MNAGSDPNHMTGQHSQEHWAYLLPEPSKTAGRWGREAIANHSNPEYWAMIWGYDGAQIVAAKAACVAKPTRFRGAVVDVE